jgi:hypothetical protein
MKAKITEFKINSINENITESYRFTDLEVT